MNKEIQYMLIQTFHPAYNSLYCDIFQQIHDSNQPYIPIVVDSPGGYTWNLSVLLDLIEDSDKPIITISSGISMSCGAVLATSGTSGLRIIGLLSIIFTTNLSIFAAFFFGAEILGIAEEFGDKR